MSVIEREIERVMLAAMWERAQANEGERDSAPNVTEMARRVAALVEPAGAVAGAVDRGRAEMLRDVLKVLETWDERHGHGRPDPVEYVRRRIGGQSGAAHSDDTQAAGSEA
jgi:hypothetical protein